jgi:leucyl aminopeptidase
VDRGDPSFDYGDLDEIRGARVARIVEYGEHFPAIEPCRHEMPVARCTVVRNVDRSDLAFPGNANRPLDIVHTRSGKTVEVGNTDAEGRLILCDALADADSENPDLLVDVATLTGAARIALGPELPALYCDDDGVANGLLNAGSEVGDPLWRMPIWRPYRREIEGKCAEPNNVAKTTFAGSIIGALYLAEFVSPKRRWIHLDVMAANTSARPGRPEGGEATALRAPFYAFIQRHYA